MEIFERRLDESSLFLIDPEHDWLYYRSSDRERREKEFKFKIQHILRRIWKKQNIHLIILIDFDFICIIKITLYFLVFITWFLANLVVFVFCRRNVWTSITRKISRFTITISKSLNNRKKVTHKNKFYYKLFI